MECLRNHMIIIIVAAAVLFGQHMLVSDEEKEAPEVRHIEVKEINPFALQGDKDKKIEVGYLGIGTSSASPVLRKQLELAYGLGLVVEYVQKESAADKAGIEQFDVLTKLNDQLLVNPQQFSVLVRMFKPQETVTITLIRKKKEITVKAELGSIMISKAELNYSAGVPRKPFLPEHEVDARELEEARKIFSRMKMVPLNDKGDVDKTLPPIFTNAAARSSMTWQDDDHTLSIETRNGKRFLTAKDREGKVLFEGPIQTEEEKEKVPEEIRDKIDRLNVWVFKGEDKDRVEIKVKVGDDDHKQSHDRDKEEKNGGDEPIF